ncbi:hypothetical protein YT1_4457 [Rhodococcus ruber]|nr:hypothetical protein YT1_4457 [Rhodococcus ruber]
MHREVDCIHTPIPGAYPRKWPRATRPDVASSAALTCASPPTT